ncbi:Type I secretion system membrane fusion protein PrsE [Marinomonas gallaica]|uniref:Membrane fusion protein (MFP) family protein n=1 Tax=Marinomonas gallaica TaxID=1806667 RepID=A0A1C3JVS4_9GAMM|nr:HlyD family type I secretion periplasmic adaptor subunit [Marinomonas gallaica]SBT19293.1 Type I secretion system membrane fusion protein PrsE [Marinomonas gallaica]SBT22698.1 Type I secretion system membrane fusion protein PrsE [Marinomonas gallaica]
MTKNTDKDSEQTPNESQHKLAQIETKKVPAAQAKNGQMEASQQSLDCTGQEDDIEVPSDDRRYIKFGIIFLILTLGLFTLWGSTAPLSSALVSSGEVVVDSYRKTIQHYEGGIIQQIFVRNGDVVEAGDPLVEMENAQFKAELANSYVRLQITRAELERLNAEQEFSNTVQFSQKLKDAAAKDPDIANALKQQSSLLRARMSAYTQEAEALKTRLEQTQAQIEGGAEQIKVLKQQLTLLREEEEAYTTLYNEGLGDNNRARELNRSILTTQNEINKLTSETARLKIQNTETNLQIATRKQEYLKDVGDRLKQTQSMYFDIQEKYQVAKDRTGRAIVRAPEQGTIVDLKVHTVGSVASAGQPLMDIVPFNDSFVVETKVQTSDINDVYVGQIADIRFSAFNSRITKVIEGEVINVSADAIEEDRGDQPPFYLTRIKVTDQGRSDMSEDMHLIPGMPAEVMIQRGDRTLFSYLIKPIKDSFARSLKEE